MRDYLKAGVAMAFAATALWPALATADHDDSTCADASTPSSDEAVIIILFHPSADETGCVLASITADPNDTVTATRSFSADGGNISVSSPGAEVDKDIN